MINSNNNPITTSNVVDGEEGSIAVSRNVTTTFVDNASTVMVPASVSNAISYAPTQHDIYDFLAKPYLLSTVNWTTGLTTDTNLYAVEPGTLLISTGVSAWYNKVLGYKLCRGTFVLTVKLNANPFQSGALLVHFIPMYQWRLTSDPSYTFLHNTNYTVKSQHPNGILDCRNTSLVIRFPYIAPVDYFDLKSNWYNWGTVFVDVLTPLVTGSGGENVAQLAIYGSFEDFELSAPIVPQAGGSVLNKKKSKKVAMVDEAAEVNKGGPISNALAMTSTVATTLSNIPFLSSYAMPVAWITRGLADLAAHFGWSKPLMGNAPHPMVVQYNRYSATSTGLDCSIPLAIDHDFALSVIDTVSIRDDDEMSLAFLKKVSAIIAQVSWSDTQTAGTSLYSLGITPSNIYSIFTKTEGSFVGTFSCGPPINYLSNLFTLWRGSIVVKIKIVKTDYHTGRLQITFTPNDGSSYVAPSLNSSIYSLREIIDITTGSEFCLTLPYLLPYRYQSLRNTSGIGYLDILVLNELRHPETASGSITLLVSMSGGDDFEFQVSSNSFNGVAYPLYAQMDSGELICDAIGDSVAASQDITHASHCIGDTFTSVKQLLSKFGSISFYGQYPVSPVNGIFISPYTCSVATATSTYVAMPTISGDAFCLLAQMYCFYRGSVRLMFSNVVPTNQQPFVAYNSPITTTSYPGSGYSIAIMGPSNGNYGTSLVGAATSPSYPLGLGLVNQSSAVGTISLTVPYYCPSKCSIPYNTLNTSNIPTSVIYQVWPDTPLSRVVLNFGAPGTTGNLLCSRSFGDDFHFSYFIGCPPLSGTFLFGSPPAEETDNI